ncbi:Ribokinase-like protein [Gautieria morchelliformis]|nr:Ribokinase-like protein [Gautieria morchelliformis]
MIIPPVVLTIAGTDPSGGAGIQADLKAFTALHCYGTSVTTALVAQNTMGVQEVHAPPPPFVEKQLRSVLDDCGVDAIKTGMLFNGAITAVVVSTLRSYYPADLPCLVVDPVCVSTSGHTLLDPEALSILRDQLLPLATVVTPNISEAELLLSGNIKITSIVDMLSAAKAMSAFGSKAVLIKGGHLTASALDINSISKPDIDVEWAEGCPGSPHNILILESNRQQYGHKSDAFQAETHSLVVDVLYQASSPGVYCLFVRPRVESKNTHGTGCTLSAALTCELSRGKTVLEATRAATRYTHYGIVTAFPLGNGNGPLNHMHNILERVLPLPNPSSPYPFISAMVNGSYDTWLRYVRHPFVRSLGVGTLPKENFVHFIKQDYHYLNYYGRAQGLIATKSTSIHTMRSSAETMLAVARETDSHVALCKSFDVSAEELVGTNESPATTAYGAYLIDIGLRGDELLLQIAVAACLFGYGEVGLWLQKEAKREGSGIILEGNPYRQWIDEYSGQGYQNAVRVGIDAIEARISEWSPSPRQFEEMRLVWERCTRLEIAFWDMALELH